MSYIRFNNTIFKKVGDTIHIVNEMKGEEKYNKFVEEIITSNRLYAEIDNIGNTFLKKIYLDENNHIRILCFNLGRIGEVWKIDISSPIVNNNYIKHQLDTFAIQRGFHLVIP